MFGSLLNNRTYNIEKIYLPKKIRGRERGRRTAVTNMLAIKLGFYNVKGGCHAAKDNTALEQHKFMLCEYFVLFLLLTIYFTAFFLCRRK